MNQAIQITQSKDVLEASFNTVQGLEKELGKWLALKLNELLKQRLNASGIKNRTGALSSSIHVRWNEGTKTVTIGVLKYGYFLSWGVGPKVKKGKVLNIADWALASMSSKPHGGNKFSYNPTYRKFGIPARKWLPDDKALEAIIDDFIKTYKA